MDTAKTVTRSSWQFLSGTMVSRVTGMLREILMAFYFGTDPAIAAFLVAFRLSNFLRRLLGEGALTIGFIPHFEILQRESPEKAAHFFRDLVYSISLVIMAITGLVVGVFAIFWRWGDLTPDNSEILQLTAIMMPGVLFICLAGLFSALLQCGRMYFLPGVSPVAFNCIWIAAVCLLRNETASTAALGLAIAVSIAFFMQWMMVVPSTVRWLQPAMPGRDWFKPKLFSAELKVLASALSLGVLGVCAIQINSAVDTLFSRYASLEGPAYLTYAIRIQQFPLAVFAIAISAAALPPMARAIAAADFAKYRELLQFALLRTFHLVFPCTIGLIIMAIAIINFAFGRGHFSEEAIVQTAACLIGYSLGLVPAAFVILIAAAFYSRKDYWTPTKASLWAVATNCFLNAYFIFALGWGAQSVAIATSAAALVNMLLLSRSLSQQVGEVFSHRLLASVELTMICSLSAGACGLAIGYLFFQDPTLQLFVTGSVTHALTRDFTQQLLQLTVEGLTFAITLLAMAWGLNHQEILQFIGVNRWKHS